MKRSLVLGALPLVTACGSSSTASPTSDGGLNFTPGEYWPYS